MYYLRSKPAANAIQFTVDKTKLKQSNDEIAPMEKKPLSDVDFDAKDKAAMVCSLENKDECLMCGS